MFSHLLKNTTNACPTLDFLPTFDFYVNVYSCSSHWLADSEYMPWPAFKKFPMFACRAWGNGPLRIWCRSRAFLTAVFCVTVKKVVNCIYCTIVPFHVAVFLLILALCYPVAVMSQISRDFHNLAADFSARSDQYRHANREQLYISRMACQRRGVVSGFTSRVPRSLFG